MAVVLALAATLIAVKLTQPPARSAPPTDARTTALVPYCAAERWALAAALSRFGTLSGLSLIRSSPTDVYANTPTLSLAKASYTSKYLAFVHWSGTARPPIPGPQPGMPTYSFPADSRHHRRSHTARNLAASQQARASLGISTRTDSARAGRAERTVTAPPSRLRR